MSRNPLRLIALSFSTLIASVMIPHRAAANEFPVASTEVILWSARSCYAEATWSKADCSALLNVIRRRSAKTGWSFLKMLKAYSVHNWKQSDHGRAALALKLNATNVVKRCTGKGKTREACEAFNAAWNQQWRDLVMHVVDVLGSRAEDPCPAAEHWAARYYRVPYPVRRIACSAPVANAFYAER